jgi:hypothetical protein
MKPKINGRTVAVIFLICLTALVGSCVVEESFQRNDFSEDQSILQEAEQWYGSNLIGMNNARTNSLVAGNPKWEKSVDFIHKGRQVVEVPIDLRVTNIFSQKEKEIKKRGSDYRLLLFKNDFGGFQPYLFKVELERDDFKSPWSDLKNLNLNRIPTDFKGRFIFFDLTGNFVGDWKIENGERKRASSFYRTAPMSNPTVSARIDSYTYHCVVTTHIHVTDAGGNITREVEYEVWDCIFTPMFSGSDPDDTSGGGSPEGCYEPHPDFEGLMVPCGSLDPDCPCCKVPPSERVLCEQKEPPCDDLPTYSIEIQNTAVWTGKNSGRYSATARQYQDGSPKPHWGLDIAANPGTPVFSVHSGEVVKVVSNIPPNKYIRDHFGNYVKIKSRNSSGEVFYLQYSHLNHVWVNEGDVIEKGQAIGLSGATGNAGDENVKKHVHIGATKLNSNNVQIRDNPENYMEFKYDSQGNVSFDPCNN